MVARVCAKQPPNRRLIADRPRHSPGPAGRDVREGFLGLRRGSKADIGQCRVAVRRCCGYRKPVPPMVEPACPAGRASHETAAVGAGRPPHRSRNSRQAGQKTRLSSRTITSCNAMLFQSKTFEGSIQEVRA